MVGSQSAAAPASGDRRPEDSRVPGRVGKPSGGSAGGDWRPGVADRLAPVAERDREAARRPGRAAQPHHTQGRPEQALGAQRQHRQLRQSAGAHTHRELPPRVAGHDRQARQSQQPQRRQE